MDWLSQLARDAVYLDILAFLVILVFVRDNRPVFKILLTVFGLRIAEIVFLFAMEHIWGLAEFKTILRFGWYLGYALIYMTCFFFIVSNTFNNSLYKLQSIQLLLASLFFMGSLEVARYVDRFILSTDAMGVFYASSQTFCSMIITVCTLFIALKLLAGRYYFKKDFYANYV